jgi:hypothetical protein
MYVSDGRTTAFIAPLKMLETIVQTNFMPIHERTNKRIATDVCVEVGSDELRLML